MADVCVANEPTPLAVPDVPRIINLNQHTYCSVYVRWEQPVEKMGILLGYRLFWRKGDLEWNVTLGLVHGYNITNLGERSLTTDIYCHTKRKCICSLKECPYMLVT